MRATTAVRTALAMGAMLCATVPTVPAAPAAYADGLAIEPSVARPGQRVTVAGNCGNADNLVEVTGAARGTGTVRDGWFEINALVTEAQPGRHVLEAMCVVSKKLHQGRFEVRNLAEQARGGGPGPDDGEDDGYGPDETGFGQDEHGGDGEHGKHKGGHGLIKKEKVVIGGFEEKEKGRGGHGPGGGGGFGPGGEYGPGGEQGPGERPGRRPRGGAETGGGGTQGPEVPWLPTGVALLVAAAGIGGTALMRSRVRGRA